MSERVMIFIDGSNLYHSLKNHLGRTDIDIGKFCAKLQEKRQLIRIYYYNAKVGQEEEPERYKQQQTFFDSVNAVPYSELRLGRLVYNNWPNTPPYEKGIDVQLATDMITHNFKNNYDIAILVAGDNDYVGAVQAVKDNGKHVEVALFGNPGTSKNLRDAADMVIAVNAKVLKNCWTKHQRQQRQQYHEPPHHEPPKPEPQHHELPKPEHKPEPQHHEPLHHEPQHHEQLHREPLHHEQHRQEPPHQDPLHQDPLHQEQPKPEQKKPRRRRRKPVDQSKKTDEGANQENQQQHQ